MHWCAVALVRWCACVFTCDFNCCWHQNSNKNINKRNSTCMHACVFMRMSVGVGERKWEMQ